MRFASCLVLVACAAASPTQRPPEPPPLERAISIAPRDADHIDVFGSSQLDRATVLARWGGPLAALLTASRDDPSRFHDAKAAVEREIDAGGTFALVNISIVTYFDAGATEVFLTVDLVDEADRARRMRFDPPPTGAHGDPDGLIARWLEYEETYRQVMADLDYTAPCPFWHCLSFGHASLVPYRDVFASRVQLVEARLTAILRDEAREPHRAAAAFLLAHLASGARVVELMLPAIRDRSELVRNNAMRVLAIIARDHPEIAIPVAPIVDALQFPHTTDRNKASAILAGLTRHQPSAAIRDEIRTRAGEVLVEMLALRQPNNHDYAYEILKNLSGQDLGEHAVPAWRAWVRQQQ